MGGEGGKDFGLDGDWFYYTIVHGLLRLIPNVYFHDVLRILGGGGDLGLERDI